MPDQIPPPAHLTGDQANAMSIQRAHANQLRLSIAGVIVIFVLLIFSVVLQRQQAELTNYVLMMCAQRQANAIKTNQNWEGLAAIERHNKFIDDSLRRERLALYENAKIAVPTCDPPR